MIDLHTNGASEYLFNRDQGNAVGVAGAEYARIGATGFVASVMTAPWESMLHAASEIVEAANQLEEDVPQGARCLGVHFEGPFLNPKFRRIHRHEWLLAANARAPKRWSTRAKARAFLVTMAPEIDGASDALRVFLENGVVCSAGHTGARYREGMLAIGLGFRSLTHAFNGMPPLDHRDPSILAAFIQDRRTLVQVICDGIHVSPVMIDILHRTLGDRVVLVTDNMPAADPGYHIEGGVMRSADGTIAGSALRIDEALAQLHVVRADSVRAGDRRRDARAGSTDPARRPRWGASRAARAPTSRFGTRSTRSSERWSAAASFTTVSRSRV